MKHLIRRYLDDGISRRDLMQGLGRAGLTLAAASTLADSLTVTPAAAAEPVQSAP